MGPLGVFWTADVKMMRPEAGAESRGPSRFRKAEYSVWALAPAIRGLVGKGVSATPHGVSGQVCSLRLGAALLPYVPGVRQRSGTHVA
jgi:hypothetical protein